MSKDLYEMGEMPPLGEVPPKMHAWLIRPERFGEPKDAFQLEVVDTPSIAENEVLVYVMAAGINYNNVWAGLGVPVNVIAARNKALFAELDADKNGQISAVEFAKASPIPTPDASVVLRIDANKDGQVSLAEHRGAALETFGKIDANKDGTLTAAEYRAVMQPEAQ